MMAATKEVNVVFCWAVAAFDQAAAVLTATGRIAAARSHVGIRGIHIHMVPRAHPSPRPKRHLDWLIHFGTAHGCDELKDRHTDHATSVAKGRVLR